MTEDVFLKKSFKSFMSIDFNSDRIQNVDGGIGGIVECMLLAVDFDQRLLRLQPFPSDYYEEEIFWARCEHCEISRPKLKVVTLNKEKTKKQRVI